MHPEACRGFANDSQLQSACQRDRERKKRAGLVNEVPGTSGLRLASEDEWALTTLRPRASRVVPFAPSLRDSRGAEPTSSEYHNTRVPGESLTCISYAATSTYPSGNFVNVRMVGVRGAELGCMVSVSAAAAEPVSYLYPTRFRAVPSSASYHGPCTDSPQEPSPPTSRGSGRSRGRRADVTRGPEPGPLGGAPTRGRHEQPTETA